MSLDLGPLGREAALAIVQRKELAELVGFETRNKYSIETVDGRPLGYAAEQGHGVGAFLFRQLLGHWRRFELHVFDAERRLLFRAVHPFRFFFQRLEVLTPDGRPIGALQQRFALFSKRFDVQAADGRVLLEVRSPLWKPWTFPFLRRGQEVAAVKKQWGGLLQEAFTDADRFRVELGLDVTPEERALLVAAGLFIDLMYFERQA